MFDFDSIIFLWVFSFSTEALESVGDLLRFGK
jgi:hypothetical protein